MGKSNNNKPNQQTDTDAPVGNRNSRRSRGNRSRGRADSTPKTYDSTMPHVVTDSKASNDPTWYTHIYPLAKDVASLSLNIPVGSQFNPLKQGFNFDDEDPQNPYKVTTKCEGQVGATAMPGILTIRIVPTIGTCVDATSAANIAAQQLYTLVRKANSGAINYDKTDLMMLVLAMDSAYMLYEYLLRLYDTFENYNYMNRYLPDTLIQAQGGNGNLVTMLADFRTLLDTFAYKLASINVPDQFDFIKRHSWLFTHVYKDSETNRAQLYLYQPDGFYVWIEGSGEKPTHLEYRKWETIFNTTMDQGIGDIQQVRYAIDTIMRPILGSQDVGTMSGDLMKAFGEAGMIKIKPVADHETLTPVFDMEVITQMINSTIFTENSDISTSWDIEPNLTSLTDGPFLTQSPSFSTTQAIKGWRKTFFNMYTESPTPEDVMVATRLAVTLGEPYFDEAAADGEVPLKSWGTEVAVGMRIYTLMHQANGYSYPAKLSIPQDVQICNSASASTTEITKNYHSMAQMLVNLSAFNYHPTVYLFENGTREAITETYGDLNYMGVIQNTDCYIWLDDDRIESFNNVAIMSEFAVKDYSTGI